MHYCINYVLIYNSKASWATGIQVSFIIFFSYFKFCYMFKCIATINVVLSLLHVTALHMYNYSLNGTWTDLH